MIVLNFTLLISQFHNFRERYILYFRHIFIINSEILNLTNLMFRDQNNVLSIKKDTVGKLLKTFDDQFKIVIFTEQQEILGKGSYGKCYLGILKNQQTFQLTENTQSKNQTPFHTIDLNDSKIKHNIVVVKQIKKKKLDFSQEELYKKEIQILSMATKISLANKNLVRCYPFTFSSEKSYYMVMQYCQGKSLDRLINKRQKQHHWFNFFEFLKIFSDILNGYSVLNKAKIMHEDLKPQNIFIKGNSFKIGDFGLSFLMNKVNMFGRGGSQSYNGIEKYDRNQNKISNKSDIYALGIIFFRLFYGSHPYYQKHQLSQYRYLQIDKLRSLTKNKGKIELTRGEQIQMFIKFYQSRKLKNKSPLIKKPQTNNNIIQNFNQIIIQLYDKNIPQLIRRMVHKEIDKRPQFIEIQRFLKQNKILEILSYFENLQNQQKSQRCFFQDLGLQQDFIQLPGEFSQIGQKICFQEESQIQKQQVLIRNTLLRTASSNSQRKMTLSKRYPKVFSLKQKILKINSISRFLMDVYYQLAGLDLKNLFTKNERISLTKDEQNQVQNYKQKKLQLQFVVQKYLLSFLNFINQAFQQIVQSFNQAQIDLYYGQNIDSLLKVIDQNREFLENELFLSENDISDFNQNQKDVERVICDQFLHGIGLQSKNVLLAYYCITIIEIKEKISQELNNKEENKQIIQKSINMFKEKEQINLIKQKWDYIVKNYKKISIQSKINDQLTKNVQQLLKSRNIPCFTFVEQYE